MFLNLISRNYLKSIFLVGILTSSFYAQYSKDDYELVKTTFTRKFNSEIIKEYLHSGISQKVITALLTLSHSGDTTFVPEILTLNFDKFGEYIAFALGQLGECNQSGAYLKEKIQFNKNYRIQLLLFDAIGKVGNLKSLVWIRWKYIMDQIIDFWSSGIGLAIANFNKRGIYFDNHDETMILQREISLKLFLGRYDLNALYALSRTDEKNLQNYFTKNVSNELTDNLIKILVSKDTLESTVNAKLSSLAVFRKLKMIPDQLNIDEFFNHSDWRIRTEAAKVVCYYKFKDKDELKNYFSLLNDENPNVARQTATALKNISIDSTFQNYLKSEIWSRLINHSTYTTNTIGELFITYCHLNPLEIFEAIKQLDRKVKKNFFYSALSENFIFPQKNLDYLLVEFPRANKNEKLEILNALIPLQKFFPQNSEFRTILLSNLTCPDPPNISVTADGLDSAFIKNNQEKLQEIILKQIRKYLDNPKYSESIISLANLSKKVNEKFNKETLALLEKSKIFSLRKFFCNETGIIFNQTKALDNFDQIWKLAFKYKQADITTNKGNFIIEFHPEVAPISVGNFCYLTLKTFFNNLVFHRVVPNFVIQTGDPESTGWGGPGYEISSEFSTTPFNRSYVGMANSGKDTDGSQWFVMHSDFPHLNGRYSNFGKVVKGMDVVDLIDQGDKIIKIELLK